MSALPPSFDDTVLDVSGDEVHLIAGWCPACEANAFPRTDHCPRCGATTERRLLDTDGTIYARAVIRVPVTIHPVPATIVQVALDGVRVGGLLRRGATAIDSPCTLVPMIMDRNGEPVTAYCFEAPGGDPDA